jgi:hypothetical protein
MRSNFEELNYQRQNVVDQAISDYLQSMSDTPPFADYQEDPQDCFELLSAYIDGEVTPAERRQVQEWLDGDPQVQRLYTRLLRVHEALKHVPPPVSSSAVELSERVFAKIDQQRQGRLYCLGGAMVAACFFATLSSFIFANNSPIAQIAKGLFNSDSQPQKGLMIALNHPVVAIPDAIESDVIEKDETD